MKMTYIGGLLAMLLSLPQLSMSDEGVLALVHEGSVSLREAPGNKSPVVGKAHLGVLLRVIGTSADRQWRKVTIEEEEGVEGVEGKLPVEGVYWVPTASIHTAAPARAEISVDVSALEKPDGIFGRRVAVKDFLFGTPDLTPPFYLSTTYTQPSDVSCSPPLLVCSRIAIPGESWENPTDDLKLREKTKIAFARGFIRPVLQIRSRVKIERIDESFYLVKLAWESPGCYHEGYLGASVELLSQRTVEVGGLGSELSHSIPFRRLTSSPAGGGIDTVRLVWKIGLEYADGSRETIIRRIFLWWPQCA